MIVESTNSATGAAGGPAAASSGAAVDYQAFLKLLVAEMKNQDPTNPMESTEYVAQLASFSQVEQSVQINKKLDDLLAASSLTQAGALIGREITSGDGAVTGTVAEVKLYSDGIVAKLQTGEEVVVTAGVVIR
ncbi:MAG: flagellar hook assembly protein FlgD [Rhizobiaceae bacterium]|nr:flagellar hook assembly protein FlgD [Rhizobiaceae bacterium]